MLRATSSSSHKFSQNFFKLVQKNAFCRSVEAEIVQPRLEEDAQGSEEWLNGALEVCDGIF